ncbi:MAG: SpoIIE family protein phosphatase [Halieaceae bacterium]|nr:SpoIIE family protein phosphatase [Halieaceae bacterium]
MNQAPSRSLLPRETFALGSIPLVESDSVLEARRKVHSLASVVAGDSLLSTRLATVVSEVGKTLQRLNNQARIEVGLCARGNLPRLLLSFVGELDARSLGYLQNFFGHLDEDASSSGLYHRVNVELTSTGVDNATLGRLRQIVEQKTRDQLLEEIQTKNSELEESLETLKRTRSAKDRMESELNIGRDIQMSMLPLSFPAFPEQGEFDVHATLYPAQEVGGDFYDMFMIDLDHFCFCVGDVSGKGVPAALFMAVTKTLIKSRAANDLSPASILSHVNSETAVGNDSAMFVTLWLAILNLQTGELVYSNAGHNPPYLMRAGGDMERLDKRHGPVIGAMEGIAYGEDSATLAPADLLYLYTDGVTEAMDIEGSLYGEDRLRDRLADADYPAAQDAVQDTVDDVWRFQGDASQADDITIMSVRYHGPVTQEGDTELILTMHNDITAISAVNDDFNGWAEKHGIPTNVQRPMNICLDELLNNIVSYGFCDEAVDEQHEIELHFRLPDSELVVTIVDDGKPFNPFGNEPPDTCLSVEDRPIGGLGVHLVKNFMDKVHYERHGENNVVTLHKHLDGENEA